jgi:Xaa-Pro aminopeptidase
MAGSAARMVTLARMPYAARLQALLPFREFTDAAPALSRLRMKKSPAEIAALRHAASVTVEAHRAAWRRLAPGLKEHQLAAAMAAVWLDAGCARPAFAPIVGSGPAGVALHYSRNGGQIDEGELVLMDAGAECGRYAADVTRTVPASGRFTPRQAELYAAVLGAYKAVLAAVKPGMHLGREGPNSLYRVALEYLDSHGRDRHGNPLGRYFTHGIGHHVGLDVHDAAEASAPLAPGMVVTIEPGIYLPDESIGIRIEDTFLVTGDGAEVLSAGLPLEIGEIEKALQKK